MKNNSSPTQKRFDVNVPNLVIVLPGYLKFNDIWFDVAPIMDALKTCV